jgi:hypothetical protein
MSNEISLVAGLGDVTIDDKRAEADLARGGAAPDAPASPCAALFAALRDATALTAPRTRAPASTRNSGADLRTDFTLRLYPQGHASTLIERYFRAETPISRGDARDRLIAASLVDLALAGYTSQPGGWILSTDNSQFTAGRVEPLPGAPRISYLPRRFTLVLYPEGVGGPKITRWFSSSAPVSWSDAAERLADAGIINPSITLAAQPGYWILVSTSGPLSEANAEPLPARKRRRRNAEPSTAFTLVTYPDGAWGERKTTRWFHTDAPMTWEAACDQLTAAGVIDKDAISPNSPGYWRLITDRRMFIPSRAQPMPELEPRDTAPMPRFTFEGDRTIERDGEAIVRIERVGLGDGLYALSPFETEQLTAQIIGLLNTHGAR